MPTQSRLDKTSRGSGTQSDAGFSKIIWLPGIAGKDITDGHTDFYARFVKPGVVLANLETDPGHFDYAVTRKHLDILRSATDAQGRRLQITTLSPPAQNTPGLCRKRFRRRLYQLFIW
jgi:agmatine/peptidylarginine deiminase